MSIPPPVNYEHYIHRGVVADRGPDEALRRDEARAPACTPGCATAQRPVSITAGIDAKESLAGAPGETASSVPTSSRTRFSMAPLNIRIASGRLARSLTVLASTANLPEMARPIARKAKESV